MSTRPRRRSFLVSTVVLLVLTLMTSLSVRGVAAQDATHCLTDHGLVINHQNPTRPVGHGRIRLDR